MSYNYIKIRKNLKRKESTYDNSRTIQTDKEKKIISGDGEKIKTVYDTWIFSKNIKSSNPNWLLVDTIT